MPSDLCSGTNILEVFFPLIYVYLGFTHFYFCHTILEYRVIPLQARTNLHQGRKEWSNIMPDNRNCASGNAPARENIVIDVNRVLDSCRDKDCFENVKVFLGGNGQEIIEKTGSIRVKNTEVIWTSLSVEPVKFNRGFYSVDVRFYVKLVLEGCICIGKFSEFEGLAVCDKKVILYGGEGSVSVFRSDEQSGFCSGVPFGDIKDTNIPFAVCEVADPIALDVKVVRPEEKCGMCCIYCDEIPEAVAACFGCSLCDMGEREQKELLVSLGFFSVIRIERPGQYSIVAQECCVPEKECCFEELDPCAVFKHMDFPIKEFCTGSTKPGRCRDGSGR